MKEILKNEFVQVIRTEDGLSWFDLTDKWNGYSGYTKAKRGIDRAEQYLSGLAPRTKSGIRMGDVTALFTQLNLKPHTYCSID
jgi:hypothetical protein